MVKCPYRWAAALLLLIPFATVARGADEPVGPVGRLDRDRAARVALALSEPDKSVSVEPADRSGRDRAARVAMALTDVGPQLVTAPAVAPAPRVKAALCPCGDKCGCCGVCPACPAANRSELDRIRDALVRVRCADGSGSGTVVWSAGGRSLVLTAGHVLTPGKPATVRAGGKWHAAELVARDEVLDLAALCVSAELPVVAVSKGDPRDGTEVLLAGVTSLWAKGPLSGRGPWVNGEWYLLGYDSDDGDSGGGVFVAGELVGVHLGRCGPTKETATTPYCVGAKSVRSFVGKCFNADGQQLAVAAAKPAQPKTPKLVGYRQVCQDGRCVWVPVYEP